MNKTATMLVAATLAFGAASCGDDGDAAASGDASLTITSPAEGATVASPVTVSVTTAGATIEPAGEVTAGAGHVHIMVDTACIATGEVIVKDDTHIHLGDGSASTEVDLAPGEHTLCVQLADGIHTAMDITSTVTFTVE